MFILLRMYAKSILAKERTHISVHQLQSFIVYISSTFNKVIFVCHFDHLCYRSSYAVGKIQTTAEYFSCKSFHKKEYFISSPVTEIYAQLLFGGRGIHLHCTKQTSTYEHISNTGSDRRCLNLLLTLFSRWLQVSTHTWLWVTFRVDCTHVRMGVCLVPVLQEENRVDSCLQTNEEKI